jgi:hypothetical protein
MKWRTLFDPGDANYLLALHTIRYGALASLASGKIERNGWDFK